MDRLEGSDPNAQGGLIIKKKKEEDGGGQRLSLGIPKIAGDLGFQC